MTPPKIYGLIGYPIGHSLSPLMHNAAFVHLNINAEYKLFPLKEPELEGFLKNIKAGNIWGLNITVPYKEKVIPFLNSVSEEAGLIGAVNTIKITPHPIPSPQNPDISVGAGGEGVGEGILLEGFNTDGEGFLKHLSLDLCFDPRNKKVALIGAGGAARAITVYLCKSSLDTLTVFDVDKDKLSALVNHLRGNFPKVNINAVDSIDEIQIEKSDLLINATPVGLKETDPCLVDEKLIHGNLLVYDLIYNPKETKLLKIARQKGARISNGLGMLLYQGMLAFEIWTGKKAPKDVMQRALLGGLE